LNGFKQGHCSPSPPVGAFPLPRSSTVHRPHPPRLDRCPGPALPPLVPTRPPSSSSLHGAPTPAPASSLFFSSLLPQRGRRVPLLLSPRPRDTIQGEPRHDLLRDTTSPSIRVAARIRHRGRLIWSCPRHCLPLSVSATTDRFPHCFLRVSPSPCLHGVIGVPPSHHRPPLTAASPEHRRRRLSSATP
jgi:hypothetical protein